MLQRSPKAHWGALAHRHWLETLRIFLFKSNDSSLSCMLPFHFIHEIKV